jgi:hypothetical protein
LGEPVAGAVVEPVVGAVVELVAGGAVGASFGSPAAGAGAVVALLPGGVSPPPSQAPKVVAKPNIKARPKILNFITPLSPRLAITVLSLLNKIPYLLIFFYSC